MVRRSLAPAVLTHADRRAQAVEQFRRFARRAFRRGRVHERQASGLVVRAPTSSSGAHLLIPVAQVKRFPVAGPTAFLDDHSRFVVGLPQDRAVFTRRTASPSAAG
jgi:hypothetical protein